jgi:hypothetical protein
MEILRERNIDIHAPRKDQCDLCCGYELGNIPIEEYESHIIRKDEARMAKAAAKDSCSNSRIIITMDLQSVLLAPKLLASAVYYKMKLQVHNFTIFRLNDHAVDLYVWHETNGGVTCNEFVSCVVDYITKLPQHVTSVVLISDGCSHQNRNKVLSSALRDLATTKNVSIEQLILERGHTMMEADSVHSVLDRQFKNAQIFSPADYVYLMRTARPSQPYNVIVIDHTFFKNYEACATNLNSIRPGMKAGDPTVTNIRAIQYQPTGDILYKLNHSDPWGTLHTSRTLRLKYHCGEVRQLYAEPVPISAQKYAHLQELTALMPHEYHDFYNLLPHK